DDLADVLAHHFVSALELTAATGSAPPAELREQAVRYLGLAGERALGLDTDQAAATLAHALELAADDDLRRPLLLERWARAVSAQGRLHESRAAFEEALAEHRRRGDNLAAGRTLTQLANL